jgi:hypothetical protein
MMLKKSKRIAIGIAIAPRHDTRNRRSRSGAIPLGSNAGTPDVGLQRQFLEGGTARREFLRSSTIAFVTALKQTAPTIF